MKNMTEEMGYEAPLVEVIEVRVEKGFAQTNIESPEIGEETEW